jgi:hypothetical protein
MAFEHNLGSLFTKKSRGSQHLRFVWIKSAPAKEVKPVHFTENMSEISNAANPNVPVIYIDAQASFGGRPSKRFSQKGRRQISPEDTHGIPLGRTTGGRKPFLGIGISHPQLPLKSAKETTETIPERVRETEFLG